MGTEEIEGLSSQSPSPNWGFDVCEVYGQNQTEREVLKYEIKIEIWSKWYNFLSN